MVRQTNIVMGRLEQFEERVVRAIAINAQANLEEETPRDTGWAAANWIPSVGQSIDLDLAGVGDTREDRQAEVAGSRSLASRGRLRLLTYKLRDGAAFITNNVPYIVSLNSGSSDQAPTNFVQAAIRQAIVDTERTGI